MEGFFQALSQFLKSDLAKNYGWVIFITFSICVCVVGAIMWQIMDKIIIPSKTIEANNAIREKEELAKKIRILKEENKSLKDKIAEYRFLENTESNVSEDQDDVALKKFLR